MQTSYEKIMALNGLSDFKKLINQWSALSSNMKEKYSGAPIILPDIFLVSDSGAGRSHLLELLSDFLTERNNLINFYGDVKYFEFMLNYCPKEQPFTEIQRLMDEVDNAAGFRSEYRGIIYIDIDEWRGHSEERYFRDFLEYLSDNSDDWLVILSVSNRDEEQRNKMEAIISSFLRVEKIVMEKPTVDELVGFIGRLLSAYGLSLLDDAVSLVREDIEVLYRNKYFDGFKTAKMLAQDIAYQAYIDNGSKRELERSDLAVFAPDSDYISRMLAKIERTKYIGFSAK